MSPILIDRIEFENYRQYGTGHINFGVDGKHKLDVLIAQNGTGKTTLLNAITWCLYQKEHQIADTKSALPLPNKAVVNKAKVGTVITVSVKLRILDGDLIIDFTRSQEFKVIKQGKQQTVIDGPARFTAAITDKNDFKNTVVKNEQDADIVVKQYFDEAIFNFYFFDGEKLKEFFADERSQVVRNSVFNISQVTLLENATNHLSSMRYAHSRKLGKNAPDIQKLYDEQEEERALLKQARQSLSDGKIAQKRAEEELEIINKALSGYEPIRHYQNERAELEATVRMLKEELAQFRSDRADFIRRYTILLNLYPRLQHTLALIDQKESSGELPPAIDKDQVKKLIDNHAKTCPLCDGALDAAAFVHLQELLDKLSVSSHTSNYLKEIKSTLEREIEEAKQYKQKKEKLTQRERDLTAREEKAKGRLKEINSILSNFDSESKQIDVSKLENKRTTWQNKLKSAMKTIGAAESTITTAKKRIEDLDAEIETFTKKIDAYNETKQIISVLESMIEGFDTIKENIMSGMRSEIESTTWAIFDSMIWKKNTFGSIDINDAYEITVYSKDGTRMTGSLSATEQMALAYAYTLAIHRASGKNCPLVIDSPLGRVSDDNRENMAKVLKEISKDKQIIMLFTPDEYSSAVKHIYKDVATVRELKLSSDESVVEGVDR